MKRSVQRRASEYTKARRSRKRWYQLVTCLAAVVVFCTTYALILPAITMETSQCGLTEHTHSMNCYTQLSEESSTEPVCTLESLNLHAHSEACYDSLGELTCGYADFVVHTHDASCYREDGSLWCPLPEIRAHTHTDSCYAAPQADEAAEGSHVHGEACYVEEQKLVCTLAEGEGHQHVEACYGEDGALICTLDESEAHQHTDACYEWVSVLNCELTETQMDAGEPAEPAQPELICEEPEIILHTHTADCFDENGKLVCGQMEVREHVHSEACFLTVEASDETQALTCTLPESEGHTHSESCYDADGNLVCALEEREGHQHSALCYGTWVLTCTLQEHVHSEACYKTQEQTEELTEEEQARVDEVVALIDALPDSDEISATLEAYDEAGDEDGFAAYYEQVRAQIVPVYVNYEAMDPRLQELVGNRDKLLELSWIWSAMTLAITDTVDVTAVNAFSWAGYGGALIVRSSDGTTVAGIGMGESAFTYWYAVQVQYENGRYTVKEIRTDGTSKADFRVPSNGFVLLYHEATLGASVSVSVGDTATLSSDFWKSNHSYNGTVYGTVTFTSASAKKNAKDNSGQLHVVTAASTRDFIELNLYDYGSGSTGRNINDKYNADPAMPGFQQSGGTSNISSLDAFRGTGYMNFGDIITDDLADGTLVTLASQNPQGINVVQDTANSPISRFYEVMSPTLVDGYPALLNGSGLGYLFGAESYSKKMNSQSVDGLFQYDAQTGSYYFNSRENFAQFNSANDTFTLYEEIFTPNFIMYPFGNFMPFNDIVHDSKQVSQINEDYFNELYLQANYLYYQGAGEQYAQLAKVLSQFMGYARDDGWGEDWTAERALEHYFYWGSELPTDDENDYNQISLDDLYSLDYDVESDFYFGMEMKMSFMQPKGGMTGPDNDQEMVFYFTGDDDVWVYIDGVLFLDLSGIHRHVGGKIDFVKGEVSYYSLNTMTGDVNEEPYKTVRFSDLVDASLLNEKGTFKDYSTHSFNFYYMERGSGSSVCRMNFNFPLLRQNSISVTKELSVDEEDRLGLLGNPDFRFQVLRENGTELFIPGGTTYDILDSAGNKIGEGRTDENGVFVLKANQTAVFSGIDEDSGKYFVRELLTPDSFEQYGTISVDGSSVTTGTGSSVVVGSDTFHGVDSPLKDVSDGSTKFHFDNQIVFKKLGSLSISKTLTPYPAARQTLQFSFRVTLDGAPLPVGTTYTVGDETRTVTQEGIITLVPGETALLSGIISGSRFTVQETAASSEGYQVTYAGSGLEQAVDENGGYVSGTIQTAATVSVTVNNTEEGVSVSVPGEKRLINPDGQPHTFSFLLEQVTDASGETLTENGTVQTASVSFPPEDGSDTAAFQFQLTYLEKDVQTPAVFYYRITEVAEHLGQIRYDPAQYIAEVTVTTEDGEFTASLTSLRRDGEALEQSAWALCFTNALVSDLRISKLVRDAEPPETEFGFSVTLTQNGMPLSGSFSAVRTAEDGSTQDVTLVLDDTGTAWFQLGHGMELNITGIPLGTAWTVTEDDTAAYSVSYRIGSQESAPGQTAAGTLPAGGDTVCFVNAAYYELPETGGAGTNWYTAGGLLLLAGAGILLLCKYQKRRKGGSADP